MFIAALHEGSSSSVASAIFDGCFFMSLDVTHIIYEHCIRDNNKVAHELSMIAKFTPPSIWLDAARGCNPDDYF